MKDYKIIIISLGLFSSLSLAVSVSTDTAPLIRDYENQEQIRIDNPKTVDAILMLAADKSNSIGIEEQKFQREGYARAIKAPEVVSIIERGYYGRIAVSYVEWSQSTGYVVDWMVIDSMEAAEEFSDKILEAPYNQVGSAATSIFQAINWATLEMNESGYETDRPYAKILDISGDGADGAPFSLLGAREKAVESGIVINALVVNLSPDRLDLMRYYSECIIGGPLSFVMGVSEWNEFPPALRRKLVKEIGFRIEDRQYAVAGEEFGSELDHRCYSGKFASIIQ